jgi:hypothetical protein
VVRGPARPGSRSAPPAQNPAGSIATARDQKEQCADLPSLAREQRLGGERDEERAERPGGRDDAEPGSEPAELGGFRRLPDMADYDDVP